MILSTCVQHRSNNTTQVITSCQLKHQNVKKCLVCAPTSTALPQHGAAPGTQQCPGLPPATLAPLVQRKGPTSTSLCIILSVLEPQTPALPDPQQVRRGGPTCHAHEEAPSARAPWQAAPRPQDEGNSCRAPEPQAFHGETTFHIP